LPQPKLESFSFTNPLLSVKFTSSANALGGFIRIAGLGIEKADSLTPKDSNGVVTIKFEITAKMTEQYYEVGVFEYGQGTESPCCTGFRINSGLPPKGDQPTSPNGGSGINLYVKPLTTTAKPVAALSASKTYENLASCRLPDGDPQLTNMTVGFAIPQGRVDLTKKTIIQILPVSFSDIPASTNPLADYDKGISSTKRFWESQSFVGTEIEVRSPITYKQLPKSVLSYELSSSLFGFQSQKYFEFVAFVIAQYESEINFSNVGTVVIVVPPATTSAEIGTWVVDTQRTFTTNEGVIYNYMLTGSGDSKNEPATWVHEYGHALGLTDMRFVDSVNSSIQRPEGLGVFDIMGSGSAAPETLLWSRFLLNILAPNQVLCISQPDTSTHWIRPLAQRDTELKGLIIPTGTYTAITIESRRSYGFDSFLSPRDQGVLVYTVDTRIPYKRSPMQIIAPNRSTDQEWYTDAALKLNESVTFDGWEITVIESGDFGDVVKVTKIR
jgi:M6 family metalloprotease-like protein